MGKDFMANRGKDFKSKDFKGKPRQAQRTFTEEVIDIDAELIKLIAKRTKLVERIRGGKGYPATPRAIKDEKQIRNAWEEKATRISRDPRLTRHLFKLLHDLEVVEKADDSALSLFNLAPARQPVNVDIGGPALGSYSRLWSVLALMNGKSITLNGIWRNQPLADFTKAMNQAGAKYAWTAPDTLQLEAGKPDFMEKGIFVGDDLLTLYLICFLSAGNTGRVRFTGDKRLRHEDITPLYRFMPSLGARLAWVIPGSRSIPVTLECSGNIPDVIDVPAAFSYEAIAALLISAMVWQRKVLFNFKDADAAATYNALNLLAPIFAAFPSAVDIDGFEGRFTPWDVEAFDFPKQILPYLAPAWSSMLLAMPFFAGGKVTLHGKWAEAYSAPLIISLLRMSGLKIELGADSVTAVQPDNARPTEAINCESLPPRLHPLFWAINARIAAKAPEAIAINNYPEGADLLLAADFLDQVGINLEEENGKVRLVGPVARGEDDKPLRSAAKNYGWVSPGPSWTLAFSLLAFIRANLKLVNPDSATEVIPGYWNIYNTLPSPSLEKLKEQDKKEPSKRRIITNAVADLTDLEIMNNERE